jgi:hypothetical protein
MLRRLLTARALLRALLLVLPAAATAQPKTTSGWEFTGIPTVNWDADEKFGYGAAVELYRYGAACQQYCVTLQPTVFLTTGGRRDFTLFADAPSLAGGWRVSAFAGSEQQLATPYYGLGNDTDFSESLQEEPNPYFYRFGRTRRQGWVTLQHRIGALPLRMLIGTGIAHTTIDTVPYDSGTTLLASNLRTRAGQIDGWSNYVRAGLVWDTRDRETGTHRGTWSELLVQRIDKALGSDESYTRWTVTDRRYIPLGARHTFANRILVQGVSGDAPFYDLNDIQTSFKQQEGLGGAKTIRGIPKNRYAGKGLAFWNAELRRQQATFGMLGKPSSLVLLAFLDAGRVWNGPPDLTSLASDLHLGYGGGVRLGWGQNFTIAVDAGHSSQSTLPIYIGLGYLF